MPKPRGELSLLHFKVVSTGKMADDFVAGFAAAGIR
jgi:hypothetical protein